MSLQGAKFQVKVTIKRDDTNALVFFKNDGQRFDQDFTVKMKVQTPYKILLTFKPPQRVIVASMKGEELEMVCEERSEEASKYVFQWNTNNVTVSKKNQRINYPLILELYGKGILELPFQMKFYKADDTGHSAWGKCLHHVDCQCICKEGSSFVEVLSQMHRNGILELPFQMKFYKADDRGHSARGKFLLSVDCDCICKEGSSFVEVLSQVYN